LKIGKRFLLRSGTNSLLSSAAKKGEHMQRLAIKILRGVGYFLTAVVALSVVSGGSTQIEIKPLKTAFKK